MREWIQTVSTGIMEHILEQKYDMLYGIFNAAPDEHMLDEQRGVILRAVRDSFFTSLEDAARDWQPAREQEQGQPVLHAGPPADAAAGGGVQYFHMPHQDDHVAPTTPAHHPVPPPPGAPPPAGQATQGKPPPYFKQPPAIVRQRMAERAMGGPYGPPAAAASSSAAAASSSSAAAPAAQEAMHIRAHAGHMVPPEPIAGPPATGNTQGRLLAEGQHPGADDRQLGSNARRQARGSKMPQQGLPHAD